jgi:hypothetical protein
MLRACRFARSFSAFAMLSSRFLTTNCAMCLRGCMISRYQNRDAIRCWSGLAIAGGVSRSGQHWPVLGLISRINIPSKELFGVRQTLADARPIPLLSRRSRPAPACIPEQLDRQMADLLALMIPLAISLSRGSGLGAWTRRQAHIVAL